ncbi:MAG: hypothetical protein F4132_02260 [Gemmatimonadetes bacterium]|nr:hypothetical protein [Gemmatimonadota bacterium]MYH17909.1 hypothetical protein [Gemmatimonadota bacterium]
MIPAFDSSGNLPPGVYWSVWEEVSTRFGTNPWRRLLLSGLREALANLKLAGCRKVYLDGSFVTSKELPNDYDACWDENGVNPTVLDPILLTFDSGRATQKARYMGELFPALVSASTDGLSFYEFFQIDKHTGNKKGIIALDLGDLN